MKTFTKKQLEEILNIKKGEHKLFMPNEIFEQLKGYVNEDGEYIEGFYDIKHEKVKRFKSSTHIAYAYAYVYLAHYMYRYCKYYYYKNYYTKVNIDEKMIKQILGFPSKSDTYTYITKKDGVLARLGYIRKESDKPIDIVILEDIFIKGKWEYSHVVMESDYLEVYNSNNRNRKINYPVKAFFREPWAEEEGYENGTFIFVHNTHLIDIDVFTYCMADSDLGVNGFYLYSFISHKHDVFKGSFNCSIKKFVSSTGLGEKTVRTQLENLEKRNMIVNDHKPYCLDKKDWQIAKSNTYGVLPYNKFISNSSEFKEMPKQRRISAKRYEEEIGFVIYEDDLDNSSINDDGEDLGQLPF
ncbi:hypothetical protein [Psychrobacillus sp. L3]|uniref:hypothetical protein n=1 Tax=Psychrobacillus sp. L3 TaxID=3236891 RepID=UPI0036F224EF